MNTTEIKAQKNCSEYLLQLCEQHGVIDTDLGSLGRNDIIINSGLVDSMGLTYMQAMIEDEFGINLSLELLITELRTIDQIASYIQQHTLGKPALSPN